MIDESQTSIDAAAEAAPDPEATAAPGVVEAVQDEQHEQPEAPETPKTFTQEELDEIVRKRLDKAERKWRREQSQPEPVAYEPPANDDPDAPADPYKIAEQLVAARDAQRAQQEATAAYQEREEEALEKYDDFQQVAYNPNLRVTDVMAQTITASEIGPDVLYWLGTNPKEADRISRLPPILQAKEIGKVEANLSANPPTRKTSSAPAPISPVTPRHNGAPVHDTTDPRSTKSMTTSEWIEAENQREMRLLEAKRR